MAPSAASGVSSLPSGFAVFTTFPDLLFIFEFVSGWRAWRRRRRRERQVGMGRGVRSPLPQAGGSLSLWQPQKQRLSSTLTPRCYFAPF